MIAITSIVLSAVAVAFSIFVFVEGRQRYKRDVFLKIHELMISEAYSKFSLKKYSPTAAR